jgi:hypothetical protein
VEQRLERAGFLCAEVTRQIDEMHEVRLDGVDSADEGAQARQQLA